MLDRPGDEGRTRDRLYGDREWTPHLRVKAIFGPAVGAAVCPDPPTGLGATPGNTQVDLAWTAPAFDGGSPLTDYTILYRRTP
jgi:hypothetical protein